VRGNSNEQSSVSQNTEFCLFWCVGGGKKVTRVEVALDGGETWLVCALDHREKPNKYGNYWCWCFWSVEVEVLDLLGAKEVAVRAWDQSLNTQPEKLIWNVMVSKNRAINSVYGGSIDQF
jgi:hypothetical protein